MSMQRVWVSAKGLAKYLGVEVRPNVESDTPFSDIEEGNPQFMLQRGEAVKLPLMLVMQGGLDDNVLPAFQEKFGETYRAAGGNCTVEVFEG